MSNNKTEALRQKEIIRCVPMDNETDEVTKELQPVLNKRQIKERNHLNTLRQIQSLPKRTASLSVCMLLGVLSIEP